MREEDRTRKKQQEQREHSNRKEPYEPLKLETVAFAAAVCTDAIIVSILDV